MRAFLRFFFGIKKKSVSANNPRTELSTVCSLDLLSHGRTSEPPCGYGRYSQALAGHRAGAPLHRPSPPSPPGKVGGCPPPLAGRRSSRGGSAGRRWGWRRLCKPKPVLLMTPATQASSLSLAPACGTMYLKKNIRTSMLRKLQNVTLEVNKTSHDSENAHNQF